MKIQGVYCRVIWSAWQYTTCKLHRKLRWERRARQLTFGAFGTCRRYYGGAVTIYVPRHLSTNSWTTMWLWVIWMVTTNRCRYRFVCCKLFGYRMVIEVLFYKFSCVLKHWNTILYYFNYDIRTHQVTVLSHTHTYLYIGKTIL